MCFYIGHPIAQAFALMMARTRVMHITEYALDRVGSGIVGWQHEQGQTRVVMTASCVPLGTPSITHLG